MAITESEHASGTLDETPVSGGAGAGAAVRVRWVAAIGALGLVGLVAAGLFVWHQHATPTQMVGGAIIKNQPPAPNFTLTDQFGGAVSLNNYKGRPVALTFLYTNCPDVCPLIASNLHQAYKQLGDQASQVGIVAVTVDPEHDTVDQVRQFSDQRGLTNEWKFLVGSRDQLTPVWLAYQITAQPDRPVSPAAQQADRGLPLPTDVVEHTAPIYLIDKRGAVRAALPVDVTSDRVTTDLRVLLSE